MFINVLFRRQKCNYKATTKLKYNPNGGAGDYDS
jgi:hypothetical protein